MCANILFQSWIVWENISILLFSISWWFILKLVTILKIIHLKHENMLLISAYHSIVLFIISFLVLLTTFATWFCSFAIRVWTLFSLHFIYLSTCVPMHMRPRTHVEIENSVKELLLLPYVWIPEIRIMSSGLVTHLCPLRTFFLLFFRTSLKKKKENKNHIRSTLHCRKIKF